MRKIKSLLQWMLAGIVAVLLIAVYMVWLAVGGMKAQPGVITLKSEQVRR